MQEIVVGKIPWRRRWQSTPVFLPGESLGQRSLAGCSAWGRKGADRTDRLTLSLSFFNTIKCTHIPTSSIFSSCRSETTTSHFPSLQSLTITILFFASVNLAPVVTSYKWNHTVVVFLWLAYFTQHNVLEVNPYPNMCQDFLTF